MGDKRDKDAEADANFLKELTSNDEALAKRWEKATGGKLSKIITAKTLDDIVFPTVSAEEGITGKQGKALAMLFRAKLSEQANADLQAWARIAYKRDLFFKSSARALVKAEDLKLFNAALGMGNVGKINFTSPKTHLEYTPDLYGAIKLLVKDRKIDVFEVDAGLLSNLGGHYRSDIDRLILYKGFAPDMAMMHAVHESTHAIQDWRNLSCDENNFIEADAFIAGAVAALSANKNFVGLEYEAAQKKAANLVMDGQATRMSKDWSKAYDGVLKAVNADPTYKGTIGVRYEGSDQEKSKDEEAALKDASLYFQTKQLLRGRRPR
ncbi:hypothetical protein JQ582_37110 [Bradyrhizobium japonicum]|uniref:hypothetical protein n=1 Tax=Bradyrhizobium TaxID=374 RepID=UPI000456BFA9|nr:hypothetical protein [Bradyrhizobium japonicum]AHY49364.1 hypothetical protein BJS_06993 [Bradyrhizobium japonicum SEMIA 5079]MBR0734823.1 hypothetical protein [Bradyrhizobium japonicum]MBR0749557.1 hypothetical protein [Bradyrhizobium japonicum]MCD9112260.1 hypothetical protein [Bradyrhizobium japonicum]MCD9258247.1 hypothetical protein [Bradyrhizobium japonicum SEMIA 5079]